MSANHHAHRVPTSRDEAARFLVRWLEGVGATFRDHVARQREALCEDCAEREQFVRMRETDALMLADRLDGVASVIRALHERAEGATSLNGNGINRDAAEKRAADKLERHDAQDDGADEWGTLWGEA